MPKEAIINSITEGKEVLLPASPYLCPQFKTNHIAEGLLVWTWSGAGEGAASHGACPCEGQSQAASPTTAALELCAVPVCTGSVEE